MSIDPNTLPDGTVVEIEQCVFAIREHGQVSGSFVMGAPFAPSKPIARVFVPVPDGMTLADAEAALADATPDQEVPRDEWANIAVGSRVRIVEVDGDEHTVTVDYVTADPWLYSKDHGYDGAKIARVYLLDAPTPPDPDAEAVEVMARAAALEAASALPWEDRSEANRDEWRDMARAALAALREHEATR